MGYSYAIMRLLLVLSRTPSRDNHNQVVHKGGGGGGHYDPEAPIRLTLDASNTAICIIVLGILDCHQQVMVLVSPILCIKSWTYRVRPETPEFRRLYCRQGVQRYYRPDQTRR